jgi:predicted small lipoprotein YifL
MRLLRLALYWLPLLLMATTCGQTGPLYLPDEPQEPTQQTVAGALR